MDPETSTNAVVETASTTTNIVVAAANTVAEASKALVSDIGESSKVIVGNIGNDLMESASPIMNWLTENGMTFAAHLISATVILMFGALIIKLISKILNKIGAKILKDDDGSRELPVRFFTSVIIKITWLLLGMIVLSCLGVNIGPLIAGLGATGLIIGFAFQESLGSLAAGLMIAFNHPFKVGDYVLVAGHEGTIKELNMMAVIMATGDNRRITIPNKQAWGSPIINYSALEKRRVDLDVGIAYGSDITKAKALALKTLSELKTAQTEPAPMVEVKALSDSAVSLTCRVWVKNSDYWPTFFAANQLLTETFNKNGIEIPFPQVDVHMKN